MKDDQRNKQEPEPELFGLFLGGGWVVFALVLPYFVKEPDSDFWKAVLFLGQVGLVLCAIPFVLPWLKKWFK